MADTTEARNYGVKKFPSIIVFVKKIPELYEGDVTDEAAVLGWALTQAGVKIKDTSATIEDPLAFPVSEASQAAPPTPKVTPKTKAAPVEAAEKTAEPIEGLNKAAAFVEALEDTPAVNKTEENEEEVELSETVDKIKNDNNVVVFFCKYSIFYILVLQLKQ